MGFNAHSSIDREAAVPTARTGYKGGYVVGMVTLSTGLGCAELAICTGRFKVAVAVAPDQISSGAIVSA